MTTEKMFEMAARQKLKFPFNGQIDVIDLWDLNTDNLDKVYATLDSELEQGNKKTLLGTKTKKNEEIELKIAIVKHIVSVKLAEDEARVKAKENKMLKQKLMEIKASKEEEELLNKTPEELDAMIAAIDEN